MAGRPLALGGSAGAIVSLLAQGLHHWEPGLDPLAGCLCATDLWQDQPWSYFFAGLLIGSALGPILDIAWLVRQRWRRWIYSRIFFADRAYGKVQA